MFDDEVVAGLQVLELGGHAPDGHHQLLLADLHGELGVTLLLVIRLQLLDGPRLGQLQRRHPLLPLHLGGGVEEEEGVWRRRRGRSTSEEALRWKVWVPPPLLTTKLQE